MTEDQEARLRRLVDKDEIRDVILSYPRGIDRGNGALIAAIYHDDALDFHGPGLMSGADFAAYTENNLERYGRFFTMHFIGGTNFAFDGSGDVAHTETYVQANHTARRDDGEDHWEVFFGRYLDRFERRDSVWKIAQRITVRDYMFETIVNPMMHQRPWQGTRDPDDPSFAHLRLERLDPDPG